MKLAKAEVVAVDRLQPHPDNYRNHDAEAIRESLRVHGQTRSIVAQKSSGLVLAGNGTLAAMKHLGYTEALVTWVDVDDATALRILAVDNRAHDRGFSDDGQLLELLNAIGGTGDWEGTGYTEDTRADLMARLDRIADVPFGSFVDGGARDEPAEQDGEHEAEQEFEQATGARELVLKFSPPDFRAFAEAVGKLRQEYAADSTSSTVILAMSRAAAQL